MGRIKRDYFFVYDSKGKYVQEGSTCKNLKFGSIDKARLFTAFESSALIEAYRTVHGEKLKEEFAGKLPKQ